MIIVFGEINIIRNSTLFLRTQSLLIRLGSMEHLKRKDNNEISKIIWQTNSISKRKKGRPRVS